MRFTIYHTTLIISLNLERALCIIFIQLSINVNQWIKNFLFNLKHLKAVKPIDIYQSGGITLSQCHITGMTWNRRCTQPNLTFDLANALRKHQPVSKTTWETLTAVSGSKQRLGLVPEWLLAAWSPAFATIETSGRSKRWVVAVPVVVMHTRINMCIHLHVIFAFIQCRHAHTSLVMDHTNICAYIWIYLLYRSKLFCRNFTFNGNVFHFSTIWIIIILINRKAFVEIIFINGAFVDIIFISGNLIFSFEKKVKWWFLQE